MKTRHPSGFVLVIVLWTLGLLSLLIAQMLTSSRTALALAETARASAAAEAAADGAVQRTIYLLLAGAVHPDAPLPPIPIGAARVAVTVHDEGQRINPNFSSPPLLAALLGAAGVGPAEAQALARRIVDWRTATPFAMAGGEKLDLYRQGRRPYGPPDKPYLSVGEIGLVPGVTPAILARIRPYLSVYQAGDPQLSAMQTESQSPDGQATNGQASGGQTARGRSIVQFAEMMNHAAVLAGFQSPDMVVRITATASISGGARFVRSAVVKMARESGGEGSKWQILAWD